MSKEQDEEIKTIKEREFKIKLSDADVKRLCEKAGEVGLTASELLENFIGDLVGGTYSNGSDERMYANEWFDRCGFGNGELGFLQWIIWSSDFDWVLDDWDDLQSFREEPEEDLTQDDKEDMLSIEEELNNQFKEYKQHEGAIKDSTLESEMAKVVAWNMSRGALLRGGHGHEVHSQAASPVYRTGSSGNAFSRSDNRS